MSYVCSPEYYSLESYGSSDTSQQQEQSGNFDNQTQFEASITLSTSSVRATKNKRAKMCGMNKFAFCRYLCFYFIEIKI